LLEKLSRVVLNYPIALLAIALFSGKKVEFATIDNKNFSKKHYLT
jgi:hypothetical protein